MFVIIGEGSYEHQKGEKQNEPHNLKSELDISMWTHGFQYLEIDIEINTNVMCVWECVYIKMYNIYVYVYNH